MEKKGGYFEFKDVDTKGRMVMGYLSAFGNVDLDNDIMQKGAFSDTIARRGPKGTKQIKYLLDHDTRKAVGVFHTLEEDNYGLAYTAQIGEHTLGLDYMKMVEGGIITEHSIGFRTLKSRNETKEVRVIEQVELYEGSGLQFLGANPATPITGTKSATDIEELFENLEKALSSGTYTDETFANIIIPRYEAVKALVQPKLDEKALAEYLISLKF